MSASPVSHLRAALALSGVPTLTSSETSSASSTAQTPVGIFVAGTTATYEYVNQRWCELSGLPPDARSGTAGRPGSSIPTTPTAS